MRRQNMWSGAQVALMLALMVGLMVQFRGAMPYNCGPCYDWLPAWLCQLNGCP